MTRDEARGELPDGISPTDTKNYCREAVLGVWRKHREWEFWRYPMVLVRGDRVTTFANPLRGLPDIAGLLTQFEGLSRGACYIGPLVVCPGRVALIFWSPKGVEAFTFDPSTGGFQESASLAADAALPNWG